MARPLFAIALTCLCAVVVIRFVFGLVGVAAWLLGLFVKLAIVALIVYFAILVISPDTARKMREHFTGPRP
jgi:hypothetical protein